MKNNALYTLAGILLATGLIALFAFTAMALWKMYSLESGLLFGGMAATCSSLAITFYLFVGTKLK